MRGRTVIRVIGGMVVWRLASSAEAQRRMHVSSRREEAERSAPTGTGTPAAMRGPTQRRTRAAALVRWARTVVAHSAPIALGAGAALTVWAITHPLATYGWVAALSGLGLAAWGFARMIGIDVNETLRSAARTVFARVTRRGFGGRDGGATA